MNQELALEMERDVENVRMEEVVTLAELTDHSAYKLFCFLRDNYPFESDINVAARQLLTTVSTFTQYITEDRYDQNGTFTEDATDE